MKQGMFKVPMDEAKLEENLPALFFVPVHGGIWTLCVTLDGERNEIIYEEKEIFSRLKFGKVPRSAFLVEP